MQQQVLWHESPEEALRSLVDALGGFKKVGAQLRPSLPADQAGRWLAQCLDSGRAEKLALDELLWLLAEGCRRGCHVASTFFMRQAGYKTPEPMDVETELQRLQREFIAATQSISALGQEIQCIGAKLSSKGT